MRIEKFVVTTANVHDLHFRQLDQPGQSNTDADEAVDGSAHSAKQGRRTAGHADGLHSADGAIA